MRVMGMRPPWPTTYRSGAFPAVYPLSLRALHQERREQRHRPARRSFFLARLPGGPGDVEVRPIVLARESRKEAGGGHAAGRASADVREVGKIALQRLLVVVPDRKSTRLNSS